MNVQQLLKKIPPVPRELPYEEQVEKEWPIIEAARRGDVAALAEIEANTRVTRECVARFYVSKPEQLADAASESWIGVTHALTKYKKEKDGRPIRFYDFVPYDILTRVRRFSRNETDVRLPKRSHEALRRARTEGIADENIESFLVDSCKLSPKAARLAKNHGCNSINTEMQEETGAIAFMATETAEPEVFDADAKAKLQEAALSLDRQERAAISAVFGLKFGPAVEKEAAEMCRKKARNLAKVAIEKLRPKLSCLDIPDKTSKKTMSVIKEGHTTTCYETFTPEEARAIIAAVRNPQRRLNMRSVDQYARAMKKGWDKYKGKAITFNRADELEEGFTRLHACVKANLPFENLVIRGVKPSKGERLIYNSGASNTLRDCLSLYGASKPHLVAPATTILFGILFPAHRGMSTAEITEAIGENRLEDLDHVRRLLQNKELAKCAPLLAALSLGRNKTPAAVERVCLALAGKAPKEMQSGRAAWLIQDLFIRTRGQGGKADKLRGVYRYLHGIYHMHNSADTPINRLKERHDVAEFFTGHRLHPLLLPKRGEMPIGSTVE